MGHTGNNCPFFLAGLPSSFIAGLVFGFLPKIFTNVHQPDMLVVYILLMQLRCTKMTAKLNWNCTCLPFLNNFVYIVNFSKFYCYRRHMLAVSIDEILSTEANNAIFDQIFTLMK